MVPAATPTPVPSPAGPASPGSVGPTPQDFFDGAAARCLDATSLCNVVGDLTGNRRVGLWVEVLLGTPFRILLILLAAVVLRFLLHRLIHRVADRIATGRAGLGRRFEERLPSATALLSTTPLLSERREQRAQATASVLRSLTTGVVAVIAVLMVIDTLGFSIAPLLASAGIVGVAVGFGAQTLVKDFISGIFMIAEDQYGVGDVVDLGEATGTVEAVGLRVTRIRDVDGTVWYIRNGEVLRVGNRSQGWARAVLDVGIAYGEDVGRAQDLLLDVARGMQDDERFGALLLEDPEVWGIESISADGVTVRLVVKTAPLQQWAVARELRRRIKERFDSEGVQVAHPQGAVWVTGDSAPGRGARGGRGATPGAGSTSRPPSSSTPASTSASSAEGATPSDRGGTPAGAPTTPAGAVAADQAGGAVPDDRGP